MWLWVRGRQLSKTAYFLCAKCQVKFRRHGARQRGGQCTLAQHLIFLSRNALSSANFRIAHFGPCLSAMTSQRRLAPLNFAMKIITIFGEIRPALMLIRCGKIVSRKRRLNKLSNDVYYLIVRFLKMRLLWRNTEHPRVKWRHVKWTVYCTLNLVLYSLAQPAHKYCQ